MLESDVDVDSVDDGCVPVDEGEHEGVEVDEVRVEAGDVQDC